MPSTPGQPFSNLQPYLVVTEVTVTSGIFPSEGGGTSYGDTLGFVYDFAGNFAPGTSFALDGQVLPISQYDVLLNLLGTTYGGDGTSNFQLPNLQGAAVLGIGAGGGLPSETLGATTGAATVSLSLSQIPASSTPAGGGGQPFSTVQLALPLQPLICITGVFPSPGGGTGSSAFLGQVAYFEGSFVPSGWALAAGQLLSIAQNSALFSILGTTYGGDGITTFALPNLRVHFGSVHQRASLRRRMTLEAA